MIIISSRRPARSSAAYYHKINIKPIVTDLNMNEWTITAQQPFTLIQRKASDTYWKRNSSARWTRRCWGDERGQDAASSRTRRRTTAELVEFVLLLHECWWYFGNDNATISSAAAAAVDHTDLIISKARPLSRARGHHQDDRIPVNNS